MTTGILGRVYTLPAVIVIAILLPLRGSHPSAQEAMLRALNQAVGLQVFPVRERIFLLVEPGGAANITVQTGPEGVLVVDTGSGTNASQVLTAIRNVSRTPIRYVINMTNRPEHIGGNAALIAAGRGLHGSDPSAVSAAGVGTRSTAIAHENLMKRMSGLSESTAAPSEAWPNLAYIGKRKDVYFNGETVQIIHAPRAQSDGDSVVFFRGSDVIATGDIFLTTTYPIVDTSRGGSLDGVISALNAVIDLTNTEKNQEGGTLVIPGHGRVTDESDVVEYRDMLTIIRGRVQYLNVAQGLTLEQVQRAKPTLDFDGRYAGMAEASGDRLVEVAYRTAKPVQAAPASRRTR